MTKGKKDGTTRRLRTHRDVDQYKSFFFLNEHVTEKFLDKLAEDLLEWAREPESLKITQFMDSVGINDRTFYKWTDRNEKLKQAHEWAMRLLGDRREIGMLKGQYKEKSVMYMMHKYDPDWSKADEHHYSKQKSSLPEFVDLNVNYIGSGEKDEQEDEKPD